MTVDSENPQPKPVTVSDAKFVKLADQDPEAPPQAAHPHGAWPGPPPHVRKFMKRKLKRGCCCLMFLMMLNLFVACYIAKRVNYISFVLSPESPIKYMPGGPRPFCSDLCIDLCESDEEYSMDCDVSNCVDACTLHFEEQTDMDYDSSDSSSSSSSSESADFEQVSFVGDNVNAEDASNAAVDYPADEDVEPVDDVEVEEEEEEEDSHWKGIFGGKIRSHFAKHSRSGRGGSGSMKPVAQDKNRRVPRGPGLFMKK